MQQQRLCAAALCLLGASLSLSAAASDLSIGATAYVNFAAYKDYDPSYYPLPIIKYETEHFYVDGITGGVKLFSNDHHEVRLGIGWMPAYFKASHSDDDQVKRLDDRDTSMVAVASYAFKTENFGRFDFAVAADTLSKSEGVFAMASYSYPHNIGWGTTIIPRVSLMLSDSNFNDYYYGVSRKEACRSGLEQYDADASLTPSFHLAVRKEIDQNWAVHGGVDLRILPSEIKDSPMADGRSTSWGIGVGVDYTFR